MAEEEAKKEKWINREKELKDIRYLKNWKKIFFIDFEQYHNHLLQIIEHIHKDYETKKEPFHIAIVNNNNDIIEEEDQLACIKIFLRLKALFKEDFEFVGNATLDDKLRPVYSQKGYHEPKNIKCELSIINHTYEVNYGAGTRTRILPDRILREITELDKELFKELNKELYQFTNYSYIEKNNIRLLKSDDINYKYKGKNNIDEQFGFRISHLFENIIHNIGNEHKVRKGSNFSERPKVYLKYVYNNEDHELQDFPSDKSIIEYAKLPYKGFRIELDENNNESVEEFEPSKLKGFGRFLGYRVPGKKAAPAGGKTRKHRKRKMRSSKRKASKKGRKSRKKKSSSKKKK